MTQPGFEAGSLVNTIPVKTHAPKAWRTLMSTITTSGPRSLSKVRRARARMLRG